MEDLLVVRNARLPQGRPFLPVAEAEMFPTLIACGQAAAGSTDAVALSEFVGPYGVADLVVAVPDLEGLARRQAAGLEPLLNEADAALVATCCAPLPIARLPRVLGWSSGMVERRVRKLQATGYLAVEAGVVRAHPAMVPVGTLHAFEAKVRDWRRGIHQAGRYAIWADTVTLVVGSLPKDTRDVRAAARKRRVGLWSSERRLLQAPDRRHPSSRRLWASEHLIASLPG